MPVETKSWPARDPDATYDYSYVIPLDVDDSVTLHVFSKLSGSAAVDSESRTDATVTAWLSGGVDGEVSVYRVYWETVGGRKDDAIITQMVVANEITALALKGYAKPSPAHLIMRYSAFAAVPPATIQFWLTDAERYVDTSWLEADYAAGLMAQAAWQMARSGLGATFGAMALPAGVTRFKSGAMDVTISDKVAGAAVSGGVAASIYEAEFIALRRRNFGGPRLVGCAA